MEIQLTKKRHEDIGRFYDFIKSDVGIIEAFFLKPDGKTKATRFYEGRDKFIEEVLAFNTKGFTCYAGIQPRDRKLLGSNQAGDQKDVVALRFLYLDIDPAKPTNLGKVNATEQEKSRCLEAALKIQQSINNGMGYKEPVLTSSGNGN